jgi:predicted nucleotidyltransferase
MTTLLSLKKRKPQIESIMQKYGARNIRVFGSVAREEDQKNSDIDFIVNMDEERSAFDLVHLIDELEEFLQKKVDIVDEEALHWFLKKKIQKEVIVL